MLQGAAAAALAAGMICSQGAAHAAGAFAPPGVYGRVNVAAGAAPETLAPQPSAAARKPPRGKAAVSYYWVPAGHRLRWTEYCHRYAACKETVAFVSDAWYFHDGPGKGAADMHGHDHDHEH